MYNAFFLQKHWLHSGYPNHYVRSIMIDHDRSWLQWWTSYWPVRNDFLGSMRCGSDGSPLYYAFHSLRLTVGQIRRLASPLQVAISTHTLRLSIVSTRQRQHNTHPVTTNKPPPAPPWRTPLASPRRRERRRLTDSSIYSCGIRTAIIFLHCWEIELQARGSGAAIAKRRRYSWRPHDDSSHEVCESCSKLWYANDHS